ncbi:MAG: molybdopterin-synthase adenylyltransferase [Acidobacteriota bacterium]|jgi:molybdopterin/thiamine biosynthesis adenylyltransferase|nr:molybdopterin-synthase adenylyltransferase [Acidobacteriota bacterium]
MKMREPRLRILFPREPLLAGKVGDLYGYRHDATSIVNVIACGEPPQGPFGTFLPPAVVGHIITEPQQHPTAGLYGHYRGDEILLFYDGQPCAVELYSLTRDLFSRHQGILESSKMFGHGVVISGCGSVGSLVALELARAGVGRFLLIDHDVLAYHNLSRHQCGVSDVGRFKVDAVRDHILDINPKAKVQAVRGTIHSLPKHVFDLWCGPQSLIVGCADNREADLYADKISCLYSIPFLSIGLWERAFAGEVFWNVPGEGGCYHCLFGNQDRGLSNRTLVNRTFYTTEENLAEVQFEPGISVDISFVTLIGIKLAIDLLNRNDPTYRPRVRSSLSQFTLICNANDSAAGGGLGEIFDRPLQVTSSIQVERRADCAHCKLIGSEVASSLAHASHD